jgi:hypothetical protein
MSAPWIALVVVLWLAVVALTVIVLGLIRRVDRLENLPTRPTRSIPSRLGPAVGSLLPAVAGYEQLTGPGPRQSRLILFLSSTCAACGGLTDELRAQAPDGPGGFRWLGDAELVVVSDAAGASDIASVTEIVFQTDGALSTAWGIPGTPFAVAVDAGGRVVSSAFASTLAQLRELIDNLGAATSGAGPSGTSRVTTSLSS